MDGTFRFLSQIDVKKQLRKLFHTSMLTNQGSFGVLGERLGASSGVVGRFLQGVGEGLFKVALENCKFLTWLGKALCTFAFS